MLKLAMLINSVLSRQCWTFDDRVVLGAESAFPVLGGLFFIFCPNCLQKLLPVRTGMECQPVMKHVAFLLRSHEKAWVRGSASCNQSMCAADIEHVEDAFPQFHWGTIKALGPNLGQTGQWSPHRRRLPRTVCRPSPLHHLEEFLSRSGSAVPPTICFSINSFSSLFRKGHLLSKHVKQSFSMPRAFKPNKAMWNGTAGWCAGSLTHTAKNPHLLLAVWLVDAPVRVTMYLAALFQRLSRFCITLLKSS